MISRIVKVVSIVLFALIIIYLFFAAVSDTGNAIKSHTKRIGYDILLPEMDFCTFAIDGNTLWAGGSTGLFKINMSTLASVKVGEYKYIRALIAVDDGLWIGHDGGLTYIGKTTVNYTTKDGLPDNRVNAIVQSRDKRLWVGTWGGVAVFDNGRVTTYTKSDGLIDNMVNVIMQDSFDGMWFGSYVAPRGGISVFINGKWQYFTTKDALLHSNISAIIEIHDKTVIAGGGLYTKGGGTKFTYNGIEWLKSGTLTIQDGLAGEKIRSLFEDSQNRLWTGSEYDGLAVLTTNKIVKLTQKTGLSCDEVKVIMEDTNSNIWIGTRKGITRILKGGIKDE